MDYREFDLAYKAARRRVAGATPNVVRAEQQQLADLVRLLPGENDRRVASGLIETLPQYAAPASPPHPLYTEALAVLDDPELGTGTAQEQVAKIAAARRKVFDLADRAGTDGAGIRSLTRMLDHREERLTDPYPWPDEPRAPGQ